MGTVPATRAEAEYMLAAARKADVTQGAVHADRVLVALRDERISFLLGYLAAC